MSPKPLPKWRQHFLKNDLIIFCQKANFLKKYFVSYDFVQISPACGPNTYQSRDFRLPMSCSVSIGSIKCSIGKSIFALNLPLKLFRATVANAYTRSLKSLHTFFDTYLGHMVAKFEPKRIVRKVLNFELSDKRTEFLKTILNKALTQFCKTF